MKTQYYTAMTLDGFVATAEDSLEWLMTLGDPEESSYPAFIAEVGALAMGSATYEWVLASGLAWPYTQPCWVFSSRELALVPGADVRVVRGEVGAVHAAMRAVAGDKNIWVVGGGGLAGQFYDAGLLDEVIVQVGAVTLGSGKGVFPRDLTGRPWRVVSAQVMGERFVELRYAVK